MIFRSNNLLALAATLTISHAVSCSAPTGSGDASTDAGTDSSREAGNCGPGNAMQPQARGDAVGAVDPETGMLYVFGGDVGPTVMCIPAPAFRNDTWKYDATCDRWEKIETTVQPSARSRAAYAVDSLRRRILLFGGRFRAASTGSYTLYKDVWAFDMQAQTWSQVMTMGMGPSERANSAVVYDPMADELVVYGGNTSTSGLMFAPMGDVWALNLRTNTWRAVMTTGTAPTTRLFHSAAMVGRAMFVFGGGGANAFMGPFYKDLWKLDLTTNAWTRVLAMDDNLMGRINAGMIADGDGVLILGGHDDGALGNRNDAIGVSTTGTVTVHVQGDALQAMPGGFCDFPADFVTPEMDTPERRSAAVVAPDPARQRVLVFGGKTDCGSANDVWIFSLTSHRWQLSRTTNDGMSCARQNRANCMSLCN
jgi:N-acetylneuraminic acid mutarotase